MLAEMLLLARPALLDRSEGRYVKQRETSCRHRDRNVAIPKLGLACTALVTQARNISHTDDLCMRTSGQMNSNNNRAQRTGKPHCSDNYTKTTNCTRTSMATITTWDSINPIT
jgi:hypothetical protein